MLPTVEKHVRGVKDARHDEAGQEPQGVVKIHLEKPLCVFLCGVCALGGWGTSYLANVFVCDAKWKKIPTTSSALAGVVY